MLIYVFIVGAFAILYTVTDNFNFGFGECAIMCALFCMAVFIIRN